MNVYDFDGTVFDGDSTLRFYRFCLARYPKLIPHLPGIVIAAVSFRCGFRSGGKTREDFKERFYRGFLPYIPDTDGAVQSFWEKESDRIKPWYRKIMQPTDVIVSASPAFLLAPICETLGVTLIASQVDPSTGRLMGPNLRGAEKVNAFRERFPTATVEKFFSDTDSDAPMASLAAAAFLVRGNEVLPWKCRQTGI